MAISLSVVITVVMEGRSVKAFETLSRIGEDIPVKVIRDGKVCLIPRRDVVLGDILCVETGINFPRTDVSWRATSLWRTSRL